MYVVPLSVFIFGVVLLDTRFVEWTEQKKANRQNMNVRSKGNDGMYDWEENETKRNDSEKMRKNSKMNA